MKKIKEFWNSLEGEAVVSKRELFLGLTACALAGIVFGVFFSPRKRTMIGSNNGNNSGNGTEVGMEDKEETK